MKTKIEVHKTDYPSPGEIGVTLQELMNWRDNRAKKDLPCGALDHAINHLRSFQALTQKIYEAELNTRDPWHDDNVGRVYEHKGPAPEVRFRHGGAVVMQPGQEPPCEDMHIMDMDDDATCDICGVSRKEVEAGNA